MNAELSDKAKEALRWLYSEAPSEMSLVECRAYIEEKWGPNVNPEILKKRYWIITSDLPSHIESERGPEEPQSAILGAVDYLLSHGATEVNVRVEWR